MTRRVRTMWQRVAIAGVAFAAACADGSASVRQPPAQTGRSGASEPVRVSAEAPDSATILYRAARRRLERGDTTSAVQGFDQVFMRWPQSDRAPHALYWKAFVLYRRGGTENLQGARNLLALATQMAPASYAVGDAATLLLRIQHRLASSGDRDALRELGLSDVTALAACEDGASADRLAWAVDAAQPAAVRLLRLRTLMRGRAPCAALLREQALLLLARIPGGAGIPDILAAARDDSSLAVRRSAIRAIPRPAPDAARALLELVLHTSSDITSLEAAAASWASRPDWGMEPLRAYLRRGDRNATAADYIALLLSR